MEIAKQKLKQLYIYICVSQKQGLNYVHVPYNGQHFQKGKSWSYLPWKMSYFSRSRVNGILAINICIMLQHGEGYTILHVLILPQFLIGLLITLCQLKKLYSISPSMNLNMGIIPTLNIQQTKQNILKKKHQCFTMNKKAFNKTLTDGCKSARLRT